MARRTAILVLAAFAAAGGLGAGEDDGVRVTASILPQGRIADTSQVRLVVQIEGHSIPEVSAPRLPTMVNLRVAGGPSSARSSSYVFENGRILSSNTMSLTYVLLPQGPGPAEVPPFDVVVGGTTFRTQALRFNVQPGRSGPAPPAGPAGQDDAAADDDAGADVFLEAKLSSREVWVGQPVVLDVILYTAAPVSGFNWIESPTLAGLWVDDVPVDPDRERANVTMNGRNYVMFPVGKKLLVPTATGRLAIAPFVAQLQLRRSARDPFGSFFSMGRFVNLLRKTRPLELTAKPLPEIGRPAEFDGAVGSYRLRVTTDRRDVEVGEAVALRATVEGRGSLQAIPPPHFSAPGELKVYEPKVVAEEHGGADRLQSKKTWEWVVVPLRPGALALPSPVFAFFDTEAGSYKVLRESLPELAVRRGAGTVDVGIARGEVQAAGKEIAFLKPRLGPLLLARAPLTRRPAFFTLLAVPWALLPVGIWWGRRRERYQNDTGFARGRRAAASAGKRLSRAAGRGHGATTAFYEDIARALVEYVADRANRSASGLTYDDLDRILADSGVSPEPRQRYRACLERCDFARFVPDAASQQGRSEIVDEAKAIVGALEAAW